VLISSAIVVSTVVPLSAVTTIWAFGKGKSPDDFTIPVVSTFGDFIGIMSILFAVKMVIP
jgi:cation transporter-like permease